MKVAFLWGDYNFICSLCANLIWGKIHFVSILQHSQSRQKSYIMPLWAPLKRKKENLWVNTPLYEKDIKQNQNKPMETTYFHDVNYYCPLSFIFIFLQKQYLERLITIRHALDESKFFKSHEVTLIFFFNCLLSCRHSMLTMNNFNLSWEGSGVTPND